MIEQGLVQLLQAGLPSTVPGGYLTELPPNLVTATGITVPQAWTYRSIASTPTIVLQGQVSFTTWLVQIDCYGNTPANSVLLARSIDNILRAFSGGTFSDPDSTKVSSITRTPQFVDVFESSNKTYVRCMDYSIQYYQS